MANTRTPESVHLWGETLCLDFANTVDWSSDTAHVEPGATDMLRTGDLLRRWGLRVRLLDDSAPTATDAEVRRAAALRAAMYRVFFSIGRGHEPSPRDLIALLSDHAAAVRRASLMRGETAYSLRWPRTDPATVRHAASGDAVALLQDPVRLGRVTRCPGRDCGWLFVNASGRRRWCSMSTCGSRDKMRRLNSRRTGSA